MGLYIVANIDGNVISSSDGLVWSESFGTGVNIGKVAIGPDRIVYAGANGDGPIATPYGLWQTSAWNHAPALVPGTDGYYFNEVHHLGGMFVAVGYQIGTVKVPLFMYSSNGVDWTLGDLDPEYDFFVGDGVSIEFTDVGYNGEGYFIIGRKDGEGMAGGFYVTDITGFVGSDQWVNPMAFPTDARQLVYAQYPEGVGNFGAWSAFSDDGKTWWSTLNEDPSQPWSFILGWDITEVLFLQTGLSNLAIAEATIGTMNGPNDESFVVWMVSTTQGQIIWWPHVPAGPYVSVPKPFTTTISTIESLNPLRVTFSDGTVLNNEKIKVIGAAGLVDLVGSYFAKSLGEGVFELHQTVSLDAPVDASGWSGSYVNGTAVVESSHGTYIDALGYGGGKFFAGNDDEQVFVCESFHENFDLNSTNLNWQKVEDLNDSLMYWNDVDYGDFSCSPSEFSYDFSPDHPERIPNWRYGGEGNMDTAIVVEGGERRSIQRTGYFDYLDGCGNRKVAEVRDGDTVTDAPSVAETTDNPIGHPTFGMNDIPSITEQVIPTGNPLAN